MGPIDLGSFLLGMAAMGAFVVLLILLSAWYDTRYSHPKRRGRHISQ